jgi:hypothetical protein
MKTTFIVVAAVCVLWGLFAMVVPINKPPPFPLWSAGAIKDAEAAVARSGTNILDGTPLTVSRGTLMILTMRAKQPDDRESQVELFRWASASFAFLAAVGFYGLSRRYTHEKSTPA